MGMINTARSRHLRQITNQARRTVHGPSGSMARRADCRSRSSPMQATTRGTCIVVSHQTSAMKHTAGSPETGEREVPVAAPAPASGLAERPSLIARNAAHMPNQAAPPFRAGPRAPQYYATVEKMASSASCFGLRGSCSPCCRSLEAAAPPPVKPTCF